MSFTDRPLVGLPRLATFSNNTGDLTLPPLTSWTNPYHTQGSFSSPPRSSSPPSTPFTTRHSHDYPHIYSSPHLDPAVYCRTPKEIYEDPTFTWHRHPVPRVHQKTQSHAPIPRSAFKYQQYYRLPSDFDSSDSSEHMDAVFGEVPSALPTRTSHRSATPLSDSQDEEQQDDPGFSFSELGIRTMYFRTSAERGRWKTDPQRPLLLSNRNSLPAKQAASNVVVSSRPISEPAPSTRKSVSASPPAEIDKRCENLQSVPEVNSASSPVTLPSIPTSPALESIDPLPPLTSDRDSSMDTDEILTPLSPLPPSSPPFSPAVSLAPLRARSTSLSNSSPSSPIIALSSPLSPISSEIGEEDALDLALTEHISVARDTGGLHQDGASTTSDLDSTPTPHDHSTCLLPEPSIIKPDPAQSTTQLIQSTEESLPSRSSRTPERGVEDSHPQPCIQSTTADEDVSGKTSEHSPEPLLKTEDPSPHHSSIKEIVPLSDIADSAENVASSHKRPKSDLDPASDDGPARKRIKTAETVPQVADALPLVMEPSLAKIRPAVKKRRKNPATSAPPTSQKRRPKYVVDESGSDSDSSISSSSSSASSSSISSSSRASVVAPAPPRRLTFSDGIERDQNGIASEDAEICGMIIEGMATSRASSLPISQVCKIVMQSRPSMKAERNEKEWCDVFDRILRSGTTGRGSGVFGKVDSSYKDEHNPAEARWFYVPEMDCDQERAALIRSMMPRPGKRNVTKKYKQYYYQPLDKISRWDPEDDL